MYAACTRNFEPSHRLVQSYYVHIAHEQIANLRAASLSCGLRFTTVTETHEHQGRDYRPRSRSSTAVITDRTTPVTQKERVETRIVDKPADFCRVKMHFALLKLINDR